MPPSSGHPDSPDGSRGVSDEAGLPHESRPGHELWETVFELAPLGMMVFDQKMRVVRANAALADMLGSTPEALVGRTLGDVTHPEDRQRSEAAVQRILTRELTWVTVRQGCLRDDGQCRWGEFALRIFWDTSGRFVNGLGIVRDITDAVRAETALRESETRNWRITESNMMGLFEWRDAVTISEANDAFLQMMDYTRDDLRAGNIRWSQILPAGSEDMVARFRDELLTTGRIRPSRTVYLSRTGVPIPVLAGAARISWEPVRGIGFVLDMSEQRKVEDARTRVEEALRESLAELEQAQARLQLADRMAAMGTLAAGVAHEINNPLGFVMANLGFAQEEVAGLRGDRRASLEVDKRLSALAWALGEAQEGAARVRNIVLDLKTFSHPDTEMRGPVDVRRVIDSALNLTQGEVRGRARVVRQFGRVPPVVGNEARLSQLFLNLIVNAAHSVATAISTIEGGGSADGVGSARLTNHEIRLLLDVASDGRVLVEVSDTGVAIPSEHLARIFDPFFTTKPIGHGTGLGLSICHGIVRSLGGEITATSTSGAGTTFHVLLPAAAESAVPVQPSNPPGGPLSSDERPVSRARILVVDDEPMMGSAIGRLLSEHEVLALTSARTALARIAAGETFDVILCDVMMPDFSGIELYAAIGAQAPELLPRLVFVTGGAYTRDAIDFLERVTNARLEKPILPAALHDAVARVLEMMRQSDRPTE